jgi:hypothetical protein
MVTFICWFLKYSDAVFVCPFISTLEPVGPTFTQLGIKMSWNLPGFLSFEFTEISNKILADEPAY